MGTSIVRAMSRAMPHADQLDREAFVLELGTRLHECGTPADRLEQSLEMVSGQLGLVGAFFSTPTSLWAGFGEPENQRVLLSRIRGGDVDLERLVLVDGLVGRVARGEILPHRARFELRGIQSKAPRYPRWLSAGCFALASAAAAIFLGGGWIDAASGGVIGLGIGVMVVATAAMRDIARLTDFLAGLISALAATAISAMMPGASLTVITLAGVIVLIPGLTLTIALRELASRHLVSGTARLTHALMIFIALGFGVAFGRALAAPLGVGAPGEPAPPWALAIGLAVAPLAFMVLFRARPVDAPSIFLAGLVGFGGARLGAYALGPELGASVGAFALACVANADARIRRLPSAVTLMPGLLLLVPGSIGFRSVDALLAADATGGLQTAFTAVLIATGLVAGLLLANVVLPSRQTL